MVGVGDGHDHFGKLAVSTKVAYTPMLWPSASIPRYILRRIVPICAPKDDPGKFIAALFNTAECWNPPKRPSAVERITRGIFIQCDTA